MAWLVLAACGQAPHAARSDARASDGAADTASVDSPTDAALGPAAAASTQDAPAADARVFSPYPLFAVTPPIANPGATLTLEGTFDTAPTVHLPGGATAT